MDRFIRSLRILWRSERLLAEQEFRLGTQRVQLNLLASLVAVIALVMLSLAMFYALAPLWGNALAALAVAGVDLVVALALSAYARSLQPPAEVAMIKEMRDMALGDLEDEFESAEAELLSVKEDVQKFIANPVDALLPGILGPLLSAIARGLASSKK